MDDVVLKKGGCDAKGGDGGFDFCDVGFVGEVGIGGDWCNVDNGGIFAVDGG